MNKWIENLNKERKVTKRNQIEILGLKKTISEMKKSLVRIIVNWRSVKIKYVSEFEDKINRPYPPRRKMRKKTIKKKKTLEALFQ